MLKNFEPREGRLARQPHFAQPIGTRHAVSRYCTSDENVQTAAALRFEDMYLCTFIYTDVNLNAIDPEVVYYRGIN
jgi:hypothetical protein